MFGIQVRMRIPSIFPVPQKVIYSLAVASDRDLPYEQRNHYSSQKICHKRTRDSCHLGIMKTSTRMTGSSFCAEGNIHHDPENYVQQQVHYNFQIKNR